MQHVLVLSEDWAKTKWLAFDIKLISCVTISHCGTKNFNNDGSYANKYVINIIAQKFFFPWNFHFLGKC